MSPMMLIKFPSRKSCFIISVLSIQPAKINKEMMWGTQYRTGVYYTDDKDLEVINQVFDEVAKKYDQPLAVEKETLKKFCSG